LIFSTSLLSQFIQIKTKTNRTTKNFKEGPPIIIRTRKKRKKRNKIETIQYCYYTTAIRL
jgi:hypothetical protein